MEVVITIVFTEKQPVKKRITITSNNKCLYCFFISITSLKKFYFF